MHGARFLRKLRRVARDYLKLLQEIERYHGRGAKRTITQLDVKAGEEVRERPFNASMRSFLNSLLGSPQARQWQWRPYGLY